MNNTELNRIRNLNNLSIEEKEFVESLSHLENVDIYKYSLRIALYKEIFTILRYELERIDHIEIEDMFKFVSDIEFRYNQLLTKDLNKVGDVISSCLTIEKIRKNIS